MSRAILTLCPTPTWPTRGPCTKPWLSSPAGWHRGAKGNMQAEKSSFLYPPCSQGSPFPAFPPSRRKFCGPVRTRQSSSGSGRKTDQRQVETDRHTDNWTGQLRGSGRAGDGGTGQLTHRQKLTLAEGQSDRQKDCRVVQWTGKGTTQETLRPEGPLWGQQ